MPSEAYIKYKSKGFWIPESFIEVLSQYICETIEIIGVARFSAGLQKLYQQCDGNRLGVHTGMVNISLDRYIDTLTAKDEVINVFDQTKLLLLTKGDEINIDSLDLFEQNKADPYFMDNWAFPIKTQSLIATIEIMEKMLNGTWPSTNYGVYYTGFPNSMSKEEI